MLVTQNAQSKLKANSYSPKYRSISPLGDSEIIIPANVGSNFTLEIVHPRPDVETHITSRHRVNYPGQPYIVPVGVMGRGFPYRYELQNAPAGMYIGEYLDFDGLSLVRRDNYGVITWYDPVPGSYTFTIKVTNAFGDIATVSTTLIVNTDWNILNTKLTSNGNGTIDSPFNTLASINNNKPTLVMDNCIVDLNTRPGNMSSMTRTWVCEYGRQSILLQGTTPVVVDQDDVSFYGFWFTAPNTRLGVQQLMQISSRNRFTLFRNKIGYLGNGFTGTNSPQNCIFQWIAANGNIGNASQYVLLHSNEFNGVNNRSLTSAYNQRRSVYENNIMINITDTAGIGNGFYFVDHCNDICYRDNKQLLNGNTQPAITVDSPSSVGFSTNFDISYNTLRCFAQASSNPTGVGAIKLHNQVGSIDSARYVFRNTVYSPNTSPVYVSGSGNSEMVHVNNNGLFYDQYSLDNNLITQNGVRIAAGYNPTLSIAGVAGLLSLGYIDAKGKWVGAHSANRGTIGSEIA